MCIPCRNSLGRFSGICKKKDRIAKKKWNGGYPIRPPFFIALKSYNEDMKTLKEIFSHEGFGVIATSSRNGFVNTAVYARPHIIDAATLAWGMTDGKTLANARENPHASYLFRRDAAYSGVRLGLKLLRIEDEGPVLAAIKESTSVLVGPAAAHAVRHVAVFDVVEIRPLV
jgi:hypothetical protein